MTGARGLRILAILTILMTLALPRSGAARTADGNAVPAASREPRQPALPASRDGDLHLRYDGETLLLRVLDTADGECYVDLTDAGLRRFFTLHGMNIRWSDGPPRIATVYANGHYLHWAVSARQGLVDGKDAHWAVPVLVQRADATAVSLRALAQLLDFRLRPESATEGDYRFVPRIEKIYLSTSADREVRLSATGPIDGARVEARGQTTVVTLPHVEWGFESRTFDFGDVAVRCGGSGTAEDPATIAVSVPVQWKTECSGQMLSNQMTVRVVPGFAVTAVATPTTLTAPRVVKGMGDAFIVLDADSPIRKIWRYDAEQRQLTIDVPNAVLGQTAALDTETAHIDTEDLHTSTFPFARIRVQLKEGSGFEVMAGEATRVGLRLAPLAVLPVTATSGGDLEPVASGQGLIVIDPGHGGGDPGAINRTLGLREKDVTLDISLRLKAALQRRGFRVVMTREEDRDVSWAHSPDAVELEARVNVANARNADLFVSVHCNASVSSAHTGTTLHWFKPSDLPLAKALEGALESGTGITDKGLIRNRFFVLRRTTMPAVLVETAYISNYAEACRLADATIRQRIAENLAEALASRYAAVRPPGTDVSTRRP